MTEKRFTLADGFKVVAIRDDGEIMNSIRVCDKLNELHDENVELHIQLDFLKDENQHMKSVLKENKELKQLIDLFAGDICTLTELLCKNNIDYKLHSDVENFIIKWGIRIE